MPNPSEALTKPDLSRKKRCRDTCSTAGQRSVRNHGAGLTLHAYHSGRGKVNADRGWRGWIEGSQKTQQRHAADQNSSSNHRAAGSRGKPKAEMEARANCWMRAWHSGSRTGKVAAAR